MGLLRIFALTLIVALIGTVIALLVNPVSMVSPNSSPYAIVGGIAGGIIGLILAIYTER